MMEDFIAKVIDPLDPEQAGRVKIRVFGIHDDKNQIPDSDLPWARCVFPVTNALVGGVSGPTTGLMKDSVVTGKFIDNDKQIPIVTGTLGRSKSSNDKPGDFPKSNAGEDYNEVLKKSHYEQATKGLKALNNPTIGNILSAGKSLSSLVSQISGGPGKGGSLMAIISNVRETVRSVNKLKDSIAGANLDQVNNILSSYVDDLGLKDVKDTIVKATDQGHIFDVLKDSAADSTRFDTSADLAAGISEKASIKQFESVADALNRINGHRFVMNNTMKKIDDALKTMKRLKNG